MRRQLGCHLAKGHVGHKLVEDKFLPDEAPRKLRLIPWNTERPGQWLQEPTQHPLQRQLLDTDPGTPRFQHAVHHGNECNKRQQHRPDGTDHLQSIHGACGRRINEVDVFLAGQLLSLLGFRRRIGLRFHELGHQQAARRRHKTGGQQILQWHTQRHVSGHDRAGNGSHPADHHRKQLGARHAWNIGSCDQWRLRLTDKHVGGSGKGFRVTGVKDGAQPAPHDADQPLHDACVIQHGDQGAEENHDRQHAERKNKAKRITRPHQPAKHEFHASSAVGQQHSNVVRRSGKRSNTPIRKQGHKADGDLQCKCQRDRSQANGGSIRGQPYRDGQEENDAQQADHECGPS